MLCKYQCNRLPRKTVSEMTYCVEWDVEPYTLTHSLMNITESSASLSIVKALNSSYYKPRIGHGNALGRVCV